MIKYHKLQKFILIFNLFIMNNIMNKKYLFLWSILVLITSIASMFLYNNIYSVNANPDYICKKKVHDAPCNIEYCWEWQKDGKRVCTWTKVTEVSYYLIRTDCEVWYTKHRAWWDVPEVSYYLIRTDCEVWYTKHRRWNSKWKSWRQWPDYVSKTESCSVVQVDNTPPIWNISWS